MLSTIGAALWAAQAAASATPDLADGLLIALRRGCLTELMGMTERARAAGMGPEAFGLKAVDKLSNKELEKSLAQGGTARFWTLQTRQGELQVASVSGLEQPVCTVAVHGFDASQAASAFLRAFEASAPWRQESVEADLVGYNWTALGRPTINVLVQAPWIGGIAKGRTVAVPAETSGLQMTVMTTVAQ